MKTYIQALDLKDDPDLINEYKQLHQDVWPEVTESLRAVGVLDMKIYSVGNRLVMLLTVEDHYEPDDAFQEYLKRDPACVRWEETMERFQQRLPGTPADQKWVPMTLCFDLADYP